LKELEEEKEKIQNELELSQYLCTNQLADLKKAKTREEDGETLKQHRETLEQHLEMAEEGLEMAKQEISGLQKKMVRIYPRPHRVTSHPNLGT
jgi:hypothetical protein